MSTREEITRDAEIFGKISDDLAKVNLRSGKINEVYIELDSFELTEAELEIEENHVNEFIYKNYPNLNPEIKDSPTVKIIFKPTPGPGKCSKCGRPL